VTWEAAEATKQRGARLEPCPLLAVFVDVQLVIVVVQSGGGMGIGSRMLTKKSPLLKTLASGSVPCAVSCAVSCTVSCAVSCSVSCTVSRAVSCSVSCTVSCAVSCPVSACVAYSELSHITVSGGGQCAPITWA
jgi:hypothetical protein